MSTNGPRPVEDGGVGIAGWRGREQVHSVVQDERGDQSETARRAIGTDLLSSLGSRCFVPSLNPLRLADG
jgi:hypothetical protein